jgi:hypothetical protein
MAAVIIMARIIGILAESFMTRSFMLLDAAQLPGKGKIERMML